uniref:Uncharacterized protein n=1 Tax=Arundo donax TaxID=35708 RepID=A0A0A8Y0S3_ARUDO
MQMTFSWLIHRRINQNITMENSGELLNKIKEVFEHLISFLLCT